MHVAAIKPSSRSAHGPNTKDAAARVGPEAQAADRVGRVLRVKDGCPARAADGHGGGNQVGHPTLRREVDDGVPVEAVGQRAWLAKHLVQGVAKAARVSPAGDQATFRIVEDRKRIHVEDHAALERERRAWAHQLKVDINRLRVHGLDQVFGICVAPEPATKGPPVAVQTGERGHLQAVLKVGRCVLYKRKPHRQSVHRQHTASLFTRREGQKKERKGKRKRKKEGKE